MLKDKKIILGITGSIAAYKAAILVRLLVKNGAEVQVVMTSAAKEFITPLTLSTLSKRPVLSDFFEDNSGQWNSHVELGLWADCFLIAPASANTIAHFAGGLCNNLLHAVYLSARCPVIIAPAMDMDMYNHPVTKRNLQIVQSFGNNIIEPLSGELASGLEGIGRMEDPDKIVEYLNRFMIAKKKKLSKRFLITAGPTQEAIDAVRYISNHSTGKMGIELANELALRGAEVTLIKGPVSSHNIRPDIKQIDVTSAEEMYQKSIELFPSMDAAIMSAAVADYTPVNPSDRKIKSGHNQASIELIPTKDIAKSLGEIKTQSQILVGFALETDNEEENAVAKLKKKNLDFIVLNSLNDKGAGFKYDTNKITIIDKDNNISNFGLKEKRLVAIDIINKITDLVENEV